MTHGRGAETAIETPPPPPSVLRVKGADDTHLAVSLVVVHPHFGPAFRQRFHFLFQLSDVSVGVCQVVVEPVRFFLG